MKKKRLMRTKERAILAGVCAGIGEYCHASPWIFRALFVLPFILNFLPGILSIGIYIVLAIFIPDQKRIEEKGVVEVDYEIVEDSNDDDVVDYSGEKSNKGQQ